MKSFIAVILIVITQSCLTKTEKAETTKPNIIIFYVDDLGYGDLSCYGATAVQTPNIDKLAANGVKFTDAHSTAATCTPSRYSLLTGSYAFRNNAAILPGDAPLLIKPGTETIASLLQKESYKTGVVGKWHLGLGDGIIDWNKEVSPGPREIGFDYSFLIPATGDRVPCVYMENQRVVNLNPTDPIKVDYSKPIGEYPTGLSHPEQLKVKADTQHSNTIINGISRIGYMEGGKSAHWIDENFPYVLTKKATQFIDERKEKPFFLFFSFHDIHVPRTPHKDFSGKTAMGPRGDAIVQMDWCVGAIMKKLDDLGLKENTLVVFTSDNGPVINDGYEDQSIELLGDHKPSGPFRGGKYSAFEAGTRVPTIVYWPQKTKPTESKALISQVDFLASIAQLTGQPLAASAAPDSKPLLSTLLGETQVGRTYMLEESFSLGIRKGDWKYIRPKQNGNPFLKHKNMETGIAPVDQLYHLGEDIGEQNNVATENPTVLTALKEKLQSIIEEGDRKTGKDIK